MKHAIQFLLTFLPFLAVAQEPSLQLVIATPKGATTSLDQTQTIMATFNQPMVPLRAVPVDEGSGPLIVEPQIAGVYRWMGSSTLVFRPSKPLPYATAYTVRIPVGTKSLNGSALRAEERWTFETPRPRVLRTQPSSGERFVELNATILLEFNQPVDPAAVASATSLEVSVGSARTFPPFVASRGDSTSSRIVLLTPRAPLPKGAAVTVRCGSGLRGSEGPLPMGGEYTLRFTTYGDLAFIGVADSGKVDPRYNLLLRFTTPVSAKDLIELLEFTPPLRLRMDAGSYDWTTDQVSIAYDFEPERSYMGRIKPGLKDRFGNTIGWDIRFTFTTGPYEPYVTMAQGIGIIEAYEKHRYPFRSLNVPTVTATMTLVDTAHIVPVFRSMNVWNGWEGNDQAMTLEGRATLTKDIAIDGTRNKQAVRLINLDDILLQRGTGIVALQLDSKLKDSRYLKALFQVTNIGLTGKFSPESTLLWVTRLKDAGPIANAAVELRSDNNAVLWRGRTDEQGLVTAPGWGSLNVAVENAWSRPRLWAIVSSGNDVAFLLSDWNDGIEPWQFNLPFEWNPQFEPAKATVFSDRGLYKAGEQVELKGILRVRREGDWKLPGKTRFRLTVRDPRNEEVLQVQPTLSPFGTFHVTVPVNANGALGTYMAQVEQGTGQGKQERWTHAGNTSFRVEAFRAAEFDVTARIDKPEAVVGDSVGAMFSARYLFGAPMMGERISWRVSATRTSWRPDGYDGYWFDDLGWLTPYGGDSYGRLLASGEGRLDGQGLYNLRRLVGVGEVRGNASLLLEADVTSPSRQSISGRASMLLHAGEFSPGLAPSTTFLARDSVLTVKYIAVSAAGALVADRSLTVRIYRRVWRSVRRAETGGRFAWESQPEDTVVDSTIVVTAQQPVERTFRPEETGFYYIDVRAADPRGNALVAQSYFYVTGRGYVPWERTNDDRIELVAEREMYRPGDVARIMVKSPYEKARALVSVEREGVLQHFVTTFEGSAPSFTIPIKPNHLPNIYVSVVLLQGRVDSAARTPEADVGRPSFKAGYVRLSVSPVERKLALGVSTDRPSYRPGDTVTVALRAKNAAGKGVLAEIAVSVADQGVLNLIAYRLPDPFNVFYAERALAVTTGETRMHLVEQRNYDDKGEPAGGGGMAMRSMAMESDEGVRKDFRAQAYWNPSVLTDADGKASVRFVLPDNLTTFQVMAVAVTKATEVGEGEASFTVNKPLLLQPAFPRFVRVGDRFEGGVLVFNYDAKPQTVTLRSSVQGLTSDGPDSAQYVVPPGQAVEVRRTFRADRTGRAVFRYRASAGRESDGLQWSIPIQVPRLRETVALSGSVTDRAAHEALEVPANVFRELGDLELTASSTALVGLSGGMSYLFTYPYGCLEQRVSSILPVILAEDLVKAFRFEVFKDRDHREVVMRTLAEISNYQRANGGFSYWKGESNPWPYLSAYTVYALVQAQRHGYEVDRGVLERGTAYLQRVLRGEMRFPWGSIVYDQCTQALILYVLALQDSPDHGYMERLFGQRQSLPLFAKAYLLKALNAGHGNAGMMDELTRDLMNRAKVAPTSAHFEDPNADGLEWVWNSSARTTALILQALVETRPENSLAPKVVRWLLDEQKSGRWRTTQENIYAVDALATYFRTYERDEPKFRAEVRLAGGAALSALFEGRSFAVERRSVPLGDLQPGTPYPLDVTKEGTGRLYYTARMNYYPTAPSQMREEGLAVLKRVEAADSDAPADTSAAGSTVRVTLTVVTNQARTFIVVDDPLPAGWEAVNTSFVTTAQTRPQRRNEPSDEESGDEAMGEEDAGWWWGNPFNHVEQRDDRVMLFADYLPAGVHTYTYLARATSFGVFGVPSTRAEGMYEPEIFGQTGQRVVVVK